MWAINQATFWAPIQRIQHTFLLKKPEVRNMSACNVAVCCVSVTTPTQSTRNESVFQLSVTGQRIRQHLQQTKYRREMIRA